MSDDRKSTTAETIAKSVEKISDSRGIGEIGKALPSVAGALAIPLIVAAMFLGGRWDGHLYPPSPQYQLQEVGGKIYKINTLTGEIVEFNPELDKEELEK